MAPTAKNTLTHRFPIINNLQSLQNIFNLKKRICKDCFLVVISIIFIFAASFNKKMFMKKIFLIYLCLFPILGYSEEPDEISIDEKIKHNDTQRNQTKVKVIINSSYSNDLHFYYYIPDLS